MLDLYDVGFFSSRNSIHTFLYYAGSLKCLTKFSLHPVISDTYFHWSISIFLCTRRLFKQFSLGRKPSMHEHHLTFKPQTGCLKIYQVLPLNLGILSILIAPLEMAASAWQRICCKQQESTSKAWRCYWAAAHEFFPGVATAPHFLQRIWNCSCKLDLAST